MLLQRASVIKVGVASFALIAGLAALFGCTGTGTGSLTSGPIADYLSTVRQDILVIRVSNNTQSDIDIQLLVDGETKLLPTCTSTARTCDYLLQTCPQSVALIRESRRDADGVYVGGREFADNPAFTFEGDQITCGSTIIYQFSDTSASAYAS